MEKSFPKTQNFYGYTDHFLWVTSATATEFLPASQEILDYMIHANQEELDSNFAVWATWVDLRIIFGKAVQEGIMDGAVFPPYSQPGSFNIRFLESDERLPPGGGGSMGDFWQCWNLTQTWQTCIACCEGAQEDCDNFCEMYVCGFNPAFCSMCHINCLADYMYCRLGCRLANPPGTSYENW